VILGRGIFSKYQKKGGEKDMKKVIAVVLAVVLMASISGVVFASQEETGNGAPSGSHYNLNIIGVKSPKTAEMDSSNGHVIFVNLSGRSKINLVEGDNYAVLDANGTDGGGALLQLPDPGLDPYVVGQDMGDVDTMSDYSVFVRPLGKPGGWSEITTCADLADSTFAGLLPGKLVSVLNKLDSDGGYASVEQVGQDITLREKGKSKFTNVTAELLTIVFKVEVDLDGDGVADEIVYVRVPIFDNIIENEYWAYDNNNLKLLQVRFYPVGTDVSEDDLLLD
jgi:hypothetical protein